MDEKDFYGGAISGAISDPDSKQAFEHAEKYYEFLRKTNSDIEKIASNTEFTIEQIILVKNYLFIDEHNLGGEIKRFDASFEIAQSWQRLAFMPEQIKKHDITLIKHELLEMKLVSDGFSYQDAHDQTEKIYNYTKESDEFYLKLQGKEVRSERLQDKKISGGIHRRRITH